MLGGGLLVRIILHHFHGTDHVAGLIFYRGTRKGDPASLFTQCGHEPGGLVCPADILIALEIAFIVLVDHLFRHIVEHQVGHHRLFAFVKRFPLAPGADHILGLESGKGFTGLVPVGNLMVGIDGKCRQGNFFDNGRQVQFTLDDGGDRVDRFGTPGAKDVIVALRAALVELYVVGQGS